LRNAIAILIFLCAILAAPLTAQPAADSTSEILALERQVMDGWSKGDPGPFLAISDPQITFIHEMTGQRLEGLAALKTLCEQYRGRPMFDSYDIQNPKVRTIGDVAILNYQLAQRVGDSMRYWNGTEVFWRTKEGWRIIHNHWSAAKTR
jgi:hypothetical protein